jgi:hypothetical protein
MGCRANQPGTQVLDRVLEFLCGPESDFPAGFDLDGFPCGWIATHSRHTVIDFDDPETSDPYTVTGFKVIDNTAEEVDQDRLGILLW